MTKEEYERLLKSDYWKGFTFSLIKERDYTCADCGRRFPNERNKLQVHHLVYRDVNPWSYKPEELLVLCEDCHKKRHGIKTVPTYTQFTSKRESENSYTKTYSYSTASKEEKNHSSSRSNGTLYQRKTYGNYNHVQPRKTWSKMAMVFICVVLVFIGISFVSTFVHPSREVAPVQRTPKVQTTQTVSHPTSTQTVRTTRKLTSGTSKKRNSSNSARRKKHSPSSRGSNQNIDISVPEIEVPEVVLDASDIFDTSDAQLVTSEKDKFPKRSDDASNFGSIEEMHHAQVVKQARKAGVSTEGSTTEILERINHAQVVKQARKAGVSTEGSTTEILERINHAQVVKQARKAGVSTEGSTIEILERINHAQVVKQARKAGVSTEGSTTEILDRIINARSVEFQQKTNSNSQLDETTLNMINGMVK